MVTEKQPVTYMTPNPLFEGMFFFKDFCDFTNPDPIGFTASSA